MKGWRDDEYCLYVNGLECSDLWSPLPDWSGREDEREWMRHIPRFTRLIACWSRLGFIKVFRSGEWPAHHTGEEVTWRELDEPLTDPASWEYAEVPTGWIRVASGDRDIRGPEEGMCEQQR